jgi:hypothetical protein
VERRFQQQQHDGAYAKKEQDFGGSGEPRKWKKNFWLLNGHLEVSFVCSIRVSEEKCLVIVSASNK